MRQPGKNNRQRGRGRRNGNGQINRNTTIDSNGPDVRLRGNALQLHEKYASLANDAAAAGERISAEAYYQYADHYFRVHSSIVAAQEERREKHHDQGSNGGGDKDKADKAPHNSADNAADNADEQADDKAVAEEVQPVESDKPEDGEKMDGEKIGDDAESAAE
ncbi:MAG: DUF4167 domain-containing protein [Alphaproteobacteria bacterium]|nr:DUF4167 domain-containing protein [Alphaproteobacteria bacterium]